MLIKNKVSDFPSISASSPLKKIIHVIFIFLELYLKIYEFNFNNIV